MIVTSLNMVFHALCNHVRCVALRAFYPTLFCVAFHVTDTVTAMMGTGTLVPPRYGAGDTVTTAMGAGTLGPRLDAPTNVTVTPVPHDDGEEE